MSDRANLFVRIHGGLGNQMFQYACARAVAARHGQVLMLDTRHYARNRKFAFGLDGFKISSIPVAAAALPPDKHAPLRYALWRSFGLRPKLRRESGLRFDASVMEIRGEAYLHGYWQSERYFSAAADIIRAEFQHKSTLDAQNAALIAEMAGPGSVSLHVRRGDYVETEKAVATHGTCSIAYYLRALALVAERLGIEPRAFIFSDDPEWVREHMRLPFPARIVSHNGPERSSEDMRLMSACAHNIIANSSFSWWGAWLNPSPDKIVVAPDRWFAKAAFENPDVCPKEWIRLNAQV